MNASKLMKVTYFDPKSDIRLLCYADTVVWDTKPTPTLIALRFGGYPERVQGLADAIYGGATIEIEDDKLAVGGIIEGSFSEEGLAAMSECEDMTTLMAKELMLGIKDSVEDVSEMFKRMANLKPQTATWSIFAESLTPVDNTVLEEKMVNEPLVEFTFGEPAPIQKQSPSRTSTPLPYPVTAAKPAARHKTPKSKISEDQILLFKIA